MRIGNRALSVRTILSCDRRAFFSFLSVCVCVCVDLSDRRKGPVVE